MSIESPTPIPIVQMGHVEKIVENTQNHSAVQQQIAHESAQRALKKQNSLVSPVDSSSDIEGLKVNDDAQKGTSGQHRENHLAKEKKDTESESTESQAHSPLSGIIINVKV